jgi:hypothetical protein
VFALRTYTVLFFFKIWWAIPTLDQCHFGGVSMSCCCLVFLTSRVNVVKHHVCLRWWNTLLVFSWPKYLTSSVADLTRISSKNSSLSLTHSRNRYSVRSCSNLSANKTRHNCALF